MINCSFDQELLTGYYDGELDEREKASVEEHIAACSDCLRSLGELKAVAVQVQSLPRASAPAAVAERVAGEVTSPFGGRTRAWFQVAVAAAALVLVAVSVVSVATRGDVPATEVARIETPSSKAGAAPVAGEKQEQGQEKELEKSALNREMLKDEAPGAERLRKAEHGDRASEDRKVLDQLEKKANDPKKAAEDAEGRNESDDHNERPRDQKRGDQPPTGSADPAKAPATEPPPAEKPADKKEWKDADKNAKGEEETKKLDPKKKEAKGAVAAGPAVLVIRGSDLGKARSEVEALLKDFAKRGATLTIGAKDLGEDANIKDRCMTLELTDAELDSLKKMLGGLKTVEVANGSFADEQERAVAWRRKLESENKTKKGDDEQLAKKDQPSASGGNAPKPAAPAKEPAKDAGKTPPDAEPTTADGKTDKPEQGGGGGAGGGFNKGADQRMGGRTTGAARKRYILVFEEKTPATKEK